MEKLDAYLDVNVVIYVVIAEVPTVEEAKRENWRGEEFITLSTNNRD